MDKFKIKWEGEIYEVEESQLGLFPGYEKYDSSEGKQSSTTPGAAVEENKASNTDLNSGNISSASPAMPTQIGNELQGLTIENIKKSEPTPTTTEDISVVPSISKDTSVMLEKAKLTGEQNAEMERLFGTDDNPNFDIFNEKTEIIQNPGVIVGGGTLRAGPSSTTQSKYFEYERSLDISEKELKQRRLKIKNEQGLEGEELDLELLNQLKSKYKLDKFKYNVDQILDKDPEYKKYKKVEGFTSVSGNINIPSSKVLQPDYEKFESQKTNVKKDIENYMKFSQKVEDLYNQNKQLGDEIQSFTDKVKDPNYNFKTLGVPESELLQLEDGRLISKNEFNQYKSNFDEYKLKEEAILSKLPYLKTQGADMQEMAISADLLSKDYDHFNKHLAKIGTGLGSAVVYGLNNATRISTILFEDDEEQKEKTLKALDEVDLAWGNYVDGTMNKYSPNIKFKDAFKDGNFGRFLGQEISTQLPIFASMAASGGLASFAGAGAAGQTIAAGVAASLPSAGEQYATMTKQDALDPMSSRSVGEKMLISSGYGMAEGLFGVAPSYLLLRNTFNALSKSGKSVVERSMKGYFGQQIAAPVFIESGGESLTTMTQNILTGRPTFENVDHSAFSGAMFAVLMNSAPATAGMFMQKFGDVDKYKEFRANNDKISEIEQSMANLNTNSSTFKSFEQQVKTLREANESILSNISNKINEKISKEAFQGYMDITSKQETLRSKASEILNDNKLTNKQKKLALNILQSDFNNLQEVRDLFRSEESFGNEFSLLKASDNKKYNSYIQKAKDSFEFYNTNTSETKVFQKASELYFEDKFDESVASSKKIKGLNNEFKSFQTNDQLLDYVTKIGANIDQNTINKFRKGITNGIQFKLKGKSYELISKENAVKNERAGTGYHEISHNALFESLGIKSDEYKPIAEQIEKWLKVNNKKVYDQMFGVEFKGKRVKGAQSADITNAEEIVVNFLERVAEGKIKPDNIKNKTFLGSIAESMNLVAGTKINFKGQTDAVNLLINFGQRIKDGTLDKTDLVKLKAGLSDLIIEADKKVQAEPELKVAASDSQAIQTMFENKGENAIMSIADNKYIKQEIKKIVNKYRDVPKFSEMKEDFEMALVSDPVYGILGSLRQYDAKRNPVLASHILFRLKQKSKTIASQMFETKFTEDVSEAKSVTDDVTNPEILDQRESLRTSLGLTESIVNKVKNSVIKTFGTKLPSVKSKDFRKKLQKAFRTELKPTIAKFLGRGVDYKQFLQVNFDLLYSIIPQSTLNKRFKPFVEPVLDENGKQKREKTAQGNPIFRKKKIKNKEFVDYFLGEDVGRSTQGTRKTALAEALAEEIAFDATLDVIRDPEIQNKIQSIVEMQGEQFDDNYLSQVAKEIDRATDFKFSESASLIIDLVNSLDGISLEENFNVFWTALIAGQVQYGLNLKDRKGQALEYFVAKELEALIPGIKILNMSDLKALKTGDTGVDIDIELNGQKYGFEIKNSISDKIGSKNGKKNILNEFGPEIANEMFAEANKITNRIIQKLDEANLPYELDSDGFVITDKFHPTEKDINKEPLKMSEWLSKLISRTATKTLPTVAPIVKLYKSKGDQYMYFGDKGWVSLGTNPLKLKVKDIYNFGLDTVIKISLTDQTRENNTKTKFNIRAYLFFGNNDAVVKPKTIKAGPQTAEVFTNIKPSESIDLNVEFNDILENSTKIESRKRYARAKATVAGKDKGKFDIIGIPPSAQDFMGLMYKFIGKGKEGDRQIKWIEKNITDLYAQAMVDISNTRVKMADKYNEITKLSKLSPKDLNEKVPGEPFTVDQAIRVYIWTQSGFEIDGLSQIDKKELNKFVAKDNSLRNFANDLMTINEDGYIKPDKNWLAGNINTDLLQGLNTDSRKQALEKWQQNVDIIFSETNLNKLEAAFGKKYRLALENMLERMKTGTNRKSKGGDALTNRLVDWINGSVGTIMFFNSRSAVLQTISAVNYLNWNDNNPLKAAAAFANQPQYWKDVMFLMNSDYLVTRRNGLKINVNEADIAEIAAESNNKAKAFVAKILKLGFLPTQIADSFAISSGGAAFYRNRINSYIKDGMSKTEAEQKAFLDFREISEESQQSSRPDRISQQQASELGRVILAFANTPSQYARIMQKAASDLINRRGDDKTNMSKIMYYGVVQNIMFNALQQALFAMMFGNDPDDELLKNKSARIANGMADSLLRGIGFHGAAISTLKNVIIKMADKGSPQDTAIELLNLSPPISSKIKKVVSANRTFQWNKKEIKEKGFAIDNPAALALGNLVSASTNIPLDRGIKKITNIKDALDSENEDWMRVANALGWAKWELEWKQPKKKKRKSTKKIKIY
tara:strand:+ start:13215 stop:20228 length:7014 start_codon:yes stop_codon:yes gene_type:complete